MKALEGARRPHPRDVRKPHSVHGGAHRRHAHAAVYELKTERPVEIGCVVLREDLTHGQRVEGFRILGIDEENKADYALFEGTCIGNKHICELEDPFAVQNPLTGHTNKKLSGVRVQITAARDEVFMREIYITKGKSVCEQK